MKLGINDLEEEFDKNDSEIETVAREYWSSCQILNGLPDMTSFYCLHGVQARYYIVEDLRHTFAVYYDILSSKELINNL